MNTLYLLFHKFNWMNYNKFNKTLKMTCISSLSFNDEFAIIIFTRYWCAITMIYHLYMSIGFSWRYTMAQWDTYVYGQKARCHWSMVLNCPINPNPRWWRCQICSHQPIYNTIYNNLRGLFFFSFYLARSVSEISMFQPSNLILKLITLFIIISP